MAKYSITSGLVALGLLCCLFGTTYALNCYSCIGCNDPFTTSSNANNLVNCTTGTTACQKVVASVAGITAVTRACVPSCVAVSVSGVGGTYCCSTDGCNFSTTIVSNKMLTLSTLALAVMFAIKRF